MAATLTSANELAYVSFPITKFETTESGDLYVYGKATDGSVDSDEQIVDTTWSSKAVAEWLATGANVRVQHNAKRDPAGVGVEVNTGDDGETWVKSLVVEPVAKTLVRNKALRAYSVGIAHPKIVRDAVARGGRIVDGEIVEISLVDRPANKNCGIELVKADKDGNAEWVGKMFGDSELLIKGEEDIVDEVTVTLPANSSFSPADLAKLLAHRATAEKRQMDPSVGGGVDRDKLPGSDFAGRDRSFPIVTPGDVSDAASSIGRAGADNYSSDELRQRITSIAHRKGPSFVAELPASWKSDDAHPLITDDDDKSDAEAKPDATKDDGMKACVKCGTNYHADAKTRKCEKCGAKLPLAVKAKKTKVMCPSCGSNQNSKHGFCTECGKTMKDAKPSTMGKNHKFTCLTCHREPLDKGERFCPGCGTENPGYLSMADGQLKVIKEGKIEVEKGKPTPDGGAVGAGATDIEPVPAHREPDGSAIEDLEADAQMPTTPDASVKAAQRLKSIGVPLDLGTLHDMTCPAFDPMDVNKSYPTDTFAGLDDIVWQQKALDAAANLPLEEAGKMTQLWQHVSTLKSADSTMLMDLREAAFKSFQDANPGPGTFPTPMELTPVRFRRPLLTDGHEAPSPAHDGPNTAKVPTDHISADDFTRGPLTAGQSADSPSNKGRTFYRNVHRETARQAMTALHDHIAQTFPDLCTVHENTGGPGLDPNPVVDPVGKSAAIEPEKIVEKTVEPVTAKAATVDAELIKSAVVDALTPLAEQVALLTKALKKEQKKSAQLAETVDHLSNLPDPTVTAFKGVAAPDALKSSTPVASTVASAAERTQAALMRVLTDQARNSPDPSEREAAWAEVYKMSGIG